ncbi:PepSY-associated TM helix domain-containing protein [Paraglaciecola aquimarina]|uniref:PepSY-associated TM helix domain-containing protein n=1 Tax=Paraglaciecola aquimarina TaxID=1235557 RepID=A0ABU3T0Y8_9ALTE|nr:PepSY-associated TM helix domain-containing protein [Paraglaciecola aquimarina]MDU0355934.1 PepSY-associated TM helix domain-containing protein [Paraglaciecola aquimarina]
MISSSITGALLVYAKDIQHFVNPDYWRVEPQSKPLDFSQLINQVEAQTLQQVSRVEPAHEQSLAWQLALANQRYVSVNPYTGSVLLEYDYYETFYGFTMAFHRWLLLQNKDGSHPFKVWVSIATLCLIVEVLLGFYLWIRPKHRLKRLKINKKAKARTLFYQLHTVIGVYLCLPIALIAFSGIAFHWPSQTSSVVEVITFSDIEQRPQAPEITAQPIATRQLTLALERG